MRQLGEKRTVFFGTSDSVFVSRTAEELRNRGIGVDIIDPYLACSWITAKGKLGKLFRLCYRIWFTKREIRKLDRDQCAVIHSLSIELFWVSLLLKSHFDKVVGIAYGSDILRRNERLDWLLSKGLARLDCLAATNTNVRDVILQNFPEMKEKKAAIVRFGLSVFDVLDNFKEMTPGEARKRLGYDAEKPIICLGYSASLGQRQKELINFFAEQTKLHERYQFVVPIQYGDSAIKMAVEHDCQRVNSLIGYDVFRPLIKFHDPLASALMRLATTVLINHSVSDAFSATVQETVYTGNMVLAGRHLPYSGMPGFNTAIKPFDSLDECTSALQLDSLSRWKSVTRLELSRNRAELRKVSSWDGVIDDWVSLVSSTA
jgi:hypothetical protein